jgi:steroid 5-alpha reductase family enzyme
MLVPDGINAAIAAMLVLVLAGWIASVARRDVSIVDSLWALFFLLGAACYAAVAGPGERGVLLLALLAVWALRLSGYLTWRNWGEPEDRRYQAIRARNQPGFAWKSLYLVFLLQGVLAFIIAMPLFAAISAQAPLNALDAAGVALWVGGFVFETVADLQLARFKSDPINQGRVLDSGLWRYTRHPNYFGETVLWWGFYLIAAAGGAWWTVFAPLLMTFLLLKVSGVTLLEQNIAERRPGYRHYILSTNAFLPGPPRSRGTNPAGEVR